ncbi:hypothetical protein FEK42_22255 [Escherichia sp. E2748]|uniref:hypothetical protein n=2 Tax=unclassified Escherichia TaxID=2608889 RepID=UPI001029D202|nr:MULTISPECIES: hypothetical protein [unclassified Escherichia]TLI73284.1 hypothetical protein FEK66_07870 [Escherichia sp. E1130]TLI74585.1 hypothetical protein FEK48_24525 [Escherichia sp. E2593]TLI78654.1 hypothetical protein FEK42_22255 [Escherichia sp. E2748]
MKINFDRLFSKKNNLQDIYSENTFITIPDSERRYPPFFFVGSGVYAYSTRFMIKSDDLAKLVDTIEERFNKKITSNKAIYSLKNSTLHYYQFKEFGQTAVDIITNDNNLIDNIYALYLEPPLPSTVFPNRDVETFGSLQGDIEAWWSIYWHPFWGRLSLEKKKHYVEQKNLSNELKEFLLLHN